MQNETYSSTHAGTCWPAVNQRVTILKVAIIKDQSSASKVTMIVFQGMKGTVVALPTEGIQRQ
jgi:hypothetical protein